MMERKLKGMSKNCFSKKEIICLTGISENEINFLIENNKLIKCKNNLIDIRSVFEYLSTESQNNLSRRKFIKQLSLGIFGTGLMGNIATNILSSYLYEKGKTIQNHNNNSFLIKELLFSSNSYSLSSSLEHFVSTYGFETEKFFHSSTFLTTQEILNQLTILSPSHNHYILDGLVNISFVDDNIICIGSPVNDKIARLSFNYQSKDRYNFSRSKDFLPFNYVNPLKDSNNLYRYIAGERHNIVNFSIEQQTNSGVKTIYTPTFNENNFLKTDYLLITKMPNIFLPNKDKHILIFGGIHGVGTEAIKLLFQSKDILEIIYKHTVDQGHHFFQSLIRIDKIQHIAQNKAYSKSIPIEISHINTIPLQKEKISNVFG